MVALGLAIKKLKATGKLPADANPIANAVAAVSVGEQDLRLPVHHCQLRGNVLRGVTDLRECHGSASHHPQGGSTSLPTRECEGLQRLAVAAGGLCEGNVRARGIHLEAEQAPVE